MRKFNFNLELDSGIEHFDCPEKELDFLHEKYIEIQSNYNEKEYRLIKIYLQGQILEKIKGVSSFTAFREFN